MRKPSYLRRVIYRQSKKLWPAVLLELVIAALLSYSSVLMMDMVNAALASDMAKLKIGAILLAVCGIGLVPFRLMYAKISTNYIKDSLIVFREAYLKKLFKKDISEFQDENNGVYLSQLTNDINTLELALFKPQLTIVNAIASFISVFVILGIYSPVVIVISLTGLGIGAVLGLMSGKPMEKPQEEKSLLLENYTSYIREVLSAFAIIKNNNLDRRVSDNFASASKAVQDKNYELDKEITWAGMRIQLTIGLIGLVLLSFMFWYLHSTSLGAGGAVLLVTAFGRLFEPVMNVSNQLPQIRSLKSLLNKMDQALENRRVANESIELGEIQEGIVFDHVSFTYEDEERTHVLEDVNYRFEMDKKYLIIGPSGGGKSTLLKLIRKLVEPTSGRILVDGEDLSDIKNESFFRQMASVEQQVFLFDDTIRNNITLFKDYPDEAIWEAIEGAGLATVVQEFPDGLEHMIRGNGSNISGGQKARIAIARALISKAKILVLDEAFASLDEGVARQIEETILSLRDVLVIQVSHVIFRENLNRYDACIRVADRKIHEFEGKPPHSVSG